ncbi:hypothetical protein NM208_g452 [Fusarium decemcellulare]|uniref:Uncharacterized protein n=1 Tax=Fusarium decemcellulare TaxID=57161 RepID=A0ACC1T051_9HYPO|nr:hypothetical protein NM208_g452 [Fusarium decemcellulare]
MNGVQLTATRCFEAKIGIDNVTVTVSNDMPSAPGFIKGIAGGNKFTSTFIIDDIQYHYSGSFNPAVQEFVSNAATLEYTSVAALTTTRDFEGKVGTQDVVIDIQPGGVKITGKLDLPISPASRVSGTGTWNQN